MIIPLSRTPDHYCSTVSKSITAVATVFGGTHLAELTTKHTVTLERQSHITHALIIYALVEIIAEGQTLHAGQSHIVHALFKTTANAKPKQTTQL